MSEINSAIIENNIDVFYSLILWNQFKLDGEIENKVSRKKSNKSVGFLSFTSKRSSILGTNNGC